MNQEERETKLQEIVNERLDQIRNVLDNRDAHPAFYKNQTKEP